MPHRILHLASSLDRFSRAEEMATLVAALPRDQFEVAIAVLSGDGPVRAQIERAGIPVHTCQRRWANDPAALARLASALRQEQPALIHSWDEASRSYAELVMPWSKCKHLVSEADYLNLPSPQWQAPLLERWRKAPNRWVTSSKGPDAPTPPQSNPLRQWTFIPPGVPEPEPPSRSREEIIASLKLPPEAMLIGVAGPLRPRYGVKELIWAADMVRVLHPQMRLLIIGDGPQRVHLERFADTAADPANICFLGDSRLWPGIAMHLDVYWQGTEPHTHSPQSLLQAMAAGVPVVASDTPQHRELIVDGESGYLCGINARALRTRVTDSLLRDKQLAEKIGNAGKVRLQAHFAFEQRVSRYLHLYRDVLDAPSA